MREIELYTADGHFVAVVEIAPFPDNGMPDVVGWGDRVFTRWRQNTDVLADGWKAGRWPYQEAFGVVSFTPSPGLPR